VINFDSEYLYPVYYWHYAAWSLGLLCSSFQHH